MRKRMSRKGWIGRGLYGIVLIGGLAGMLLAVAQGVTVTLRAGVQSAPPQVAPQASVWTKILRLPPTDYTAPDTCNDLSGNNDSGYLWKDNAFTCFDYETFIGADRDRLYFASPSSVGYCHTHTGACKNIPYVAFSYNLKGPNTVYRATVVRGTVYVSGNNYAAQHHYPGYVMRSSALIWLPNNLHNMQPAPGGGISYLTLRHNEAMLHECAARATDCRRIFSCPWEDFGNYAWGSRGHLYLIVSGAHTKANEITISRLLGSGQLRTIVSIRNSNSSPPFAKLPGGRFLLRNKVYDQNGRVLVVIPPLPGVRAANSAYDLFYFGNVLYGYEPKGTIYRYTGPL